MNQLKTTLPAIIILICLSGYTGSQVYAQGSMPEALDTGTMQEQFDYLEERTRIYNDFRAIREDMFQKIKSNTIDSLTAEKNNVFQLKDQLQDQSTLIESLQVELQSTNGQLDQAIKNRDRLTFLGMSVHKILYNTIMWTIIAALAFLSGVLFLSNKRFYSIARNNKNDIEEIKEEFEAYRKKSRERYEQLAVQHHNELRKLKGK
ncbi:MAG: hypothetical protein ISS19_10930 [Bacteroidales bacterium]|nr:hypothetical protein [Bacteroidales bacterium]